MKEIIKNKMVNQLHRRNSSASSTASVDYTSADRLLFKFSGLQALQVPKGWDKLSVSIISVETGKTIAKTGRASAQNGNCQWTEDLSEHIWVPHDYASKGLEQCLYKLLISMGSGRSGILGDVTVNLSVHLSSETSISIAQPLKNCSHGTILQAEIQCLTPLTNLRNDRWTDTDSFTEDANASDDLDTTSEVSDGRVTKSPESSVSNNFVYTSQAGGLSNRDRYLSGGESGCSFDSMDDSFSKESYSPLRNISEAANDLIGRLDSIGSSNSANSAQYSSYNVHDSPKPSDSPYSSGSGKHIFNQRQDSGKISHSIPASPLRTFGSTEFVLESEGATVDDLRAESKMWERNARKLKVDQNFSREEFRDQTRKLQSASMEIIALHTECDSLKHEISYLKVLLDESEVKEKAAKSLKDDIHIELQEEIKFQRDLNNNLSLQLKKTQESNLDLVSVLQELEETIEKQKLEIESLNTLKGKIKELERDCNDLTHENLELVFKLKESSKDLSACVKSTEDPEMIELKCEIQKLKEEAKNSELIKVDDNFLQIRCSDLECKCVELEIIIQSFKDKAWYLDGELNKYREKAEERESEVTALKELLKLQQEEKHESKCVELEEAKKIELDKIDADFLRIRCCDLERKSVELEFNIQGFKDKASYLDGELHKCHEKAAEQENEVTALKELLKLQQEEKHENSSAGAGIAGSNFKDDSGILEKLNTELKSRLKELGQKLLTTISENEALKSESFLKDREIQRLDTQVSDLNLLKSQLMGGLKAMQTESTIISECLDKVKSDMVVLNDTKESHVAANKILEKKLLELESCNKELELQLTELEVENLHFSERISGLEPQLRYLTDARESSRLEMQHSETRVMNLQADIQKLEEEAETCKDNMRRKFQEMQKRWLEAQEECEYLKKANPKLQTTAENLIEECSQLQKSNRELRQQRLDLYNRCTLLEAELRESQHDFSKFSINLEILEGKFSLMINEIATKEQIFDSELEALYLKNEEQTEKLIMGENLFNQMYSEKMSEIENLQQEVKHLNTQMYSSRDERDRMASEAVHNMHVLRAEKHKLEKAIEDVTEKFRSSEKKVEAVQLEYEEKIQDLTVELASSRENHGVLEANLKKVMELLEYTRSNEEKLRFTVGEVDGNLKQCEYQSAQLTEEITSLQDQLQKIPSLQDEVVALKNSLNDVKFENERLEASLQMITGDYKELKEEKASLLQRTYSMQKVVIELEDYKRSKVVLEEQVMRLQGDLTAREALCAQDAELKNELGRLKRSNSQLQWKINSLQDEKDECIKNAQVLEEKLEQTKYLNPDEIECSTNNSAISFRSDSMNSLHEHMKLPEDVEAKIQLLEKELAEALEANDTYKSQINSFLSKGQIQQFNIPLESEVDGKIVDKEHEKDVSLLETELKELQERYLHMSLKYAEVEAQREELVSKLKAVRPGKGWFS